MFLTCLAENEYVQIDDKKKEVLIHGKSCNLIYLVSDLIANLKRHESFNSRLYKFLKSSIFPKTLIAKKHVLKRSREFGEISKEMSFSDSTPSGRDDFKRY